MFFHYRTQGFVLKKNNKGEANQLITIYTKDFGKVEILGKAIRKGKSKLRGAIELFYLSEIEFIQGKIHKTLTDAVLIESFSNLKKDLERLSVAFKISEVLDNLIKGQETDTKIWNLLTQTFKKLNDCQLSIINIQLLYYFFLWNFFSVLGYQPELYNCSICQEKLKPGKLFFNQEKPGIICNNCFKDLKSVKEISPELVKILRLILEKNLLILLKLKVEKVYLKSLNIISKEYYSFIHNNQVT